MKRLFKVLGAVAAVPVVMLGAGVGYLYAALPKALPAPKLVIERTPERVARGEYLAEHVTGCVDCHSERDPNRFTMPVVSGTEGKGGMRFGPELGVPGEVYAPNITPAGIGNYSDGELVRAITMGVAKDGRPLFPLMPWQSLSHLCDSDLEAIVAYVRTLPPIESRPVPKAHLDFPVNLIVRTLPSPREAWACPDPNDRVGRGKYLVTMAGCADCHTPSDQGKPRPGMLLAGGTEFRLPTGGTVRSANLTPHAETGIGGWSKATFVARFAAMRDPSLARSVKPGEFNSVMPWQPLSGMTDDDLGAIYEYLRTVPAVEHGVAKFAP